MRPLADGAWTRALQTADEVLLYLGLAAFLLGTAYCWVYRRGPEHTPDAGTRKPIGPDAVLVPMLVWLLAGALLGGLLPEDPNDPTTERGLLLVGNVAQLCGAAACVAIGAGNHRAGAGGFLLGERRLPRDAAWALAGWLSAMAVCSVVLWLTQLTVRAVEPNYPVFEHDVIKALQQGMMPAWVLWIGAVVIAPLAEESFFRGLLQPYLTTLLRRPRLAIVLVGLVFGVIHAGGGDSPQPHVVPAMSALGIVLGVVYARTGSLLSPMLVHAAFNAKTLVWVTLLNT